MSWKVLLYLGVSTTTASAATMVAPDRVVEQYQGNGETALLVDEEFESSIAGQTEPDHTGAVFELVSSTSHDYIYSGPLLDAGVDLYLVDPDDEFDAAGIAAGRFIGVEVGISYDFGSPVYLGFATPSAASSSTEFPPAYSWALVQSGAMNAGDPRQLFVIDSATAFDAKGIVVGTIQAIIPEPGSGALLMAGLTMLLAMRRGRGRRPS